MRGQEAAEGVPATRMRGRITKRGEVSSFLIRSFKPAREITFSAIRLPFLNG